MKQEYELVSKQGSAFPSWPIKDTTGKCGGGGEVTKKTSKLKVKTPLT